MKIFVGSHNPVKIGATRKAFSQYFEDIDVQGVKVDSRVSDQPMSATETYEGAYNRAKACLEQEGCDFGVGIEGGLEEFPFGTTTCGFVVILGKNGEEGFGTSARMLLPNHYMREIRMNNKELGDLTAEASEGKITKQDGGMFGFFSQGVVGREDAYYQGVVFALSKIVSKDLYQK